MRASARTVGVDLAAEPAGTALASIDWHDGRARLVELAVGVTDERILASSEPAGVVGIDCPFGWPIEFVEFVSANRRREAAPREFAGKQWRQRIRYRDTDRYVRGRIGRWPLSVATDLLSLAAMHGAELLEAFERAGVEVDRAGGGRLVEVYPAASLRRWGVDVTGYKRRADDLKHAVGALLAAATWLEVSDEHRALMTASDDAMDAVVASLTARAHARRLTEPVPPEFAESARSEGWIALPTGTIGDLIA